MLYQIFRKQVPIELLMNLLRKICLKTDKYYLIDANAFKILKYNNFDNEFCSQLLDYYHSSKQHYVTREFTYKSFTNIVRHICKSNAVMYSSKIKFEKSQYNIDYYIYITAIPKIIDNKIKV
jgi:hypothetical protein